jgi:hypothetical protein
MRSGKANRCQKQHPNTKGESRKHNGRVAQQSIEELATEKTATK